MSRQARQQREATAGAVARSGGDSDVLAYIRAKAQDPREWSRRTPRITHPAILALVREITEAHPPGRTLYDDDVERYVEDRIGGLPPHLHHGHDDRHPLTYALGHEVYIARGVLRDEENQAALDAALADGYAPLDESAIAVGKRYLLRFGTLYTGYEVPVYGPPKEARGRLVDGQVWLMPPRSRAKAYRTTDHVLAKVLA